jgi:hypothetical protein
MVKFGDAVGYPRTIDELVLSTIGSFDEKPRKPMWVNELYHQSFHTYFHGFLPECSLSCLSCIAEWLMTTLVESTLHLFQCSKVL